MSSMRPERMHFPSSFAVWCLAKCDVRRAIIGEYSSSSSASPSSQIINCRSLTMFRVLFQKLVTFRLSIWHCSCAERHVIISSCFSPAQRATSTRNLLDSRTNVSYRDIHCHFFSSPAPLMLPSSFFLPPPPCLANALRLFGRMETFCLSLCFMASNFSEKFHFPSSDKKTFLFCSTNFAFSDPPGSLRMLSSYFGLFGLRVRCDSLPISDASDSTFLAQFRSRCVCAPRLRHLQQVHTFLLSDMTPRR